MSSNILIFENILRDFQEIQLMIKWLCEHCYSNYLPWGVKDKVTQQIYKFLNYIELILFPKFSELSLYNNSLSHFVDNKMSW